MTSVIEFISPFIVFPLSIFADGGYIVLAASLRLRFPVPARFPNPNSARDRLFSRISEIRTEAISRGDLSDENLTLCYAYSTYLFFGLSR